MILCNWRIYQFPITLSQAMVRHLPQSDLMKNNACTVDINQIPVSHVIEISSNDVNLRPSDDRDSTSVSDCARMNESINKRNVAIQFYSDDNIPLSHLLNNALFTSNNDG